MSFEFKYLGKIDFKFEKNSVHLSGDQMDLLMKKER